MTSEGFAMFCWTCLKFPYCSRDPHMGGSLRKLWREGKR